MGVASYFFHSRGAPPPRLTRSGRSPRAYLEQNVAALLPLLFEQAVDVLGHVERHEVVDPLADADVADRQLEVVRKRDGDAAFRRPIKLRQHGARTPVGAPELTPLRPA